MVVECAVHRHVNWRQLLWVVKAFGDQVVELSLFES